MIIELKIEKRDKNENLTKLRKSGVLPAVFYGKKNESTPIKMSHNDFLKVWKKAGESSVIILKGEGEDLEALITDIDFDPVANTPRHADFYVFEKGHKIEVDIPLEFIGVSPAVKDFGGILVKVMYNLPIKAMPKDLPHEIQVDISSLVQFDSLILAKDIALPKGVELNISPEEVLVSVSIAKEEKEEVATIDLSAIEVEKKGKEETAEDDTSKKEN